MQFSPEIPWVEVSRPSAGAVQARCTVCGAQVVASMPAAVAVFATRHQTHTAPPGFLGLGDLVAKVAKPIAAALGKKPCSPCEARRNALNHARIRALW